MSSRLSSCVKQDLLLLMCVVVVSFRVEINEESSLSVGCEGGSHGIRFSTGGMTVVYTEGCGWKKESLSLRWNESMAECNGGRRVVGDVLGRGRNFVPKPKTIFSVGLRT